MQLPGTSGIRHAAPRLITFTTSSPHTALRRWSRRLWSLRLVGVLAAATGGALSPGVAHAMMPEAKPGAAQAGAAQTDPAIPKAKPGAAARIDPVDAPAQNAPQAITHVLSGGAAVPARKPEISRAAPALAYAPVVEAPKHEPDVPRRASGPSAPASTGSVAELKKALEAIGKGNIGAAMLIRTAMRPSLDRRIIDWRLIVSGDPLISTRFISDFAREAPHWPDAEMMRTRAEIAFYREKPTTNLILKEFSREAPSTITGRLLYARALLDARHGGDAARVIRALWREEELSADLEKSILGDFSKQLRHEDHRWRVERLLYAERTNDALRNAKHLRSDERAYVKARVAVIRRTKDAARLMGQVPRSMHADAGYVFAKIQMLRRANKDKDAIALMLKAPRKPEDIVDGDEWWIERRLQSRSALDLGDARSAYAIAAGHAAQSPAKYAEAEFHAGWFALRFLNDPRRAQPHFANITKVATTPITSSRASYWLGRTAEALGQRAEATSHYRRAAQYSTAYYGQLAHARLGLNGPAVAQPPAPSASERRAFESNELVHAIRRMIKAGRMNDADRLFRHLGLTLKTPGEVALAIDLAQSQGEHQTALMIGKLAAGENNDVAALAFPTAAIPAKTKIVKGVEKPVVYAIARQESAFNPQAVSHAGARGLLQLMPATAKRTARNAGLPYNKGKLTSDAAYNATLGAAHLGELVDDFGGSYIMTFAAYNAGARRVREWVERFGDPRSPKVDAVDWIERIPFTETRNYVQRITENLQVYRARLDGGKLAIAQDIKRGG
ncbi:lytic transglycosylase domain-containing protein [Breoghania sp. L-A4]|uniref:lytic transglycosylase domain-containing protein n=1 Tax=Breoghania sp. L-A4 TaxID=2304600 RepID=UPI0013C2CDCB|nr:lytic transglycosylase domain-containing protein [Breoghania sp. L-A4]